MRRDGVYSRLFSSSWLRSSSSCGCMLLMDWKRESTALSLVILRPRMWLLFMRFRKVVTAFCRALRNCSWFSSDSPFWYCCWGSASQISCTKVELLKSENVFTSVIFGTMRKSLYKKVQNFEHTLNVPPLCWWAEQGRGFPLAGWLASVQPMSLEQEQRGWDSCALPLAFSPSKSYSDNEPAGKMNINSHPSVHQLLHHAACWSRNSVMWGTWYGDAYLRVNFFSWRSRGILKRKQMKLIITDSQENPFYSITTHTEHYYRHSSHYSI